jgi:HNH endonuclease
VTETIQRQCVQCGRTFRAGSNQVCNLCRTTDRECITCGKAFRGRDRECYSCKATDHPCVVCGQVFHGVKRTCERCRGTERPCVACGRVFRGTKNTCPACNHVDRLCAACGQQFRGTSLTCARCSATDRICAACGKTFRGNGSICRSCRVTDRQCASCGRMFRGDQAECARCRYAERQCKTCGQTFRSAFYTECGACSGRTDAGNHRRRALRIAAEVAGPLPKEVYTAVRASGPCVYCGTRATTVDHIRPLTRGGHEAEYNLAPACAPCNKSKGRKLLTEWDAARVAHAAARSPMVAAELKRLTDDANKAIDSVIGKRS